MLNLSRRTFGAASVSGASQFDRMESIYQGYFAAANRRKVVCIGRNYKSPNPEANTDLPTEPMWFDKPFSSVILDGSTLQLEKGKHADVAHEVEVGVVIAKNGRNIKPENALKHIAGYFVGIDFCNRGILGEHRAIGADWTMAKGSDDFAAVSEYIHKSAVNDHSNIELEVKVNGASKVKSNTGHMIFDIPTMIADISKYQELRQGDILFTGTPGAAGPLNHGDELACAIRNGDDTATDLVTLNISINQQ